MKRIVMAVSAVAALTAGSTGAANALDFGVGPGGVYVGPEHYQHRYYDEYGGCRMVTTRQTNEFGNMVIVRRRICD